MAARHRHTVGAVTAGLFALLTLPLVAGLLGILLPAAGWMPVLGAEEISLGPTLALLETPGLWRATGLSLVIGLSATALSLLAGLAILGLFASTVSLHGLRRVMGPLIAVPHSAVAIGILFLLAPSGWLMRIISPELTGFTRPPGWGLVPDPNGAGLVFALMAKEIPFICLVGLAAIATQPVRQITSLTSGLGYSRHAGWWLVVAPLVYRSIRLPLAAVLVYSLSVVDMAVILGPSLPPPLAVLVVQGFEDADLAKRLPASVGAVLQLIIAIIAITGWRGGEIMTARILQQIRQRGLRLTGASIATRAIGLIGSLPVLAGTVGLAAAAIWSFAAGWFFPDALPARFGLAGWSRIDTLLPALISSLIIATAATTLSTFICLVFLQGGMSKRQHGIMLAVILAPLLVPQVSLMMGLQMTLAWTRLDGTYAAMIWLHALFILPYAWLVLAPAHAAVDPRYDHAAAALGASSTRRFLQVTLPLMAPAIATVLFLGVAVSVALYLPSLFAGGGRITTVTVEAVAMAAGGSRQMTGVAAMLQLAIPLTAFVIIQGWYRWRFEKFAGMRAGGLH